MEQNTPLISEVFTQSSLLMVVTWLFDLQISMYCFFFNRTIKLIE